MSKQEKEWDADVTISFPKRTIESVIGLLREIEHPIVTFSHDRLEMANEAVRQCQIRAMDAIALLTDE